MRSSRDVCGWNREGRNLVDNISPGAWPYNSNKAFLPAPFSYRDDTSIPESQNASLSPNYHNLDSSPWIFIL